jgi:membrane protease YdiL (CAAX protease family)
MPDIEQAPAPLRERLAEGLRGFGPLGGAACAVIVVTSVFFTPAAAVLVIVWAWLSRTPWRAIGLVRPRSWATVLVLGVALGLAEKFLMKAIVLPLLGAPANNTMFGDLSNDPRRVLFLIFYMIVGAGFCEELFFRGYVIERLGRLMGRRPMAQFAIVVLSAAFFGVLHYQQGLAGIENATIGGVLAACIYLINRRQLWLLVVMHATFDLCALALIYFHLESTVAHSVFK